jgi:putative membrane protein
MLYLALKAVHIMAIISWMAGLFYLPRLFVYHALAAPNGEASETFKVMERRLLNQITTPAMIASWVMGGAIVLLPAGWAPDTTGSELVGQYWYLAKLALVIGLTVYHFMLIHCAGLRPRRECALARLLPFLQRGPHRGDDRRHRAGGLPSVLSAEAD